jgi:hypothetical protein
MRETDHRISAQPKGPNCVAFARRRSDRPLMSRRAFGLALLGATVLALSSVRLAHAESTVSLFIIERNKNANVVHYDGRLVGDTLDPKEPVAVYWIMNDEDGRREGLTLLERRLAFGFDIGPGAQPGTYTMRLAAFKERALTLTNASGRWRAVIAINGKPAYLRRIYVKADAGFPLPRVRYVDIFGEDEAGKPVQERLVKA